jgi:Fe-S oxidoreductase
LRALGVGAPAENLLRLVPGMKVNRIEKGCSGMAGLWGVKRDNYRASLRAGLDLISTVRDGPFQIGTTECSTCKMQMEQGSAKPTIHPIKLLALAYGLMPEVADLVRSGGNSLVVS